MSISSICFECGRYDANDGEDLRWVPREKKCHSIFLKMPLDNSYCELVDTICRKINVDKRRTELKISYYRVYLNGQQQILIEDDDDVTCYVLGIKDEYKSLLHVEVDVIGEEDHYTQHFYKNDRGSGIGLRDDVVGAVIISEPSLLNEFEPTNEEFASNDVAGAIIIRESSPTNELLCTHDEPLGENVEEDNQEGYFIEDVAPESTVEESHYVHHSWEDGLDWIVGQEFGSKREVQDLIDKASCLNCFEYSIVRSNRNMYVVKCLQVENGCKWAIRVARSNNSDYFSVRTYTKMHTCSRATGSTSKIKRKGTPRLVASVVSEEFPGQLDTPKAKTLVGMVKGKLGMTVSYTTAWRGRKLAASDIRGSPEESYRLLYCYLYMLEKLNPNTITRVEVDDANKFKYLFFALGHCIAGFKVMRKVIIVDGTFLKSEYGGVMLVATAQDPNHHHYPIAFGVVDGEKDLSWLWFMKMLKLVVEDSSELVFLSDRNTSILKSIKEVYPHAAHAYCMFHLSQNVKSKVSHVNKENVAKKFRECAQAYTEGEFEHLYIQFRNKYPSAAQYLDGSVEVEKWARCYFPGQRYNINTTNCAESLNAVFIEARYYSLLPLIDAIVGKLAEWFNKRRKSSCEVPITQVLVPFVENMMHDRCKEAKTLVVKELNSYVLQYNVIGCNGMSYLVDLRGKSCTCKHFDIDKYPCVHALASLFMARRSGATDISIHDLCSEYYNTVHWVLAYSKTLYPVTHHSTWVIPEEIRAKSILPPSRKKKGKGRPRESRYPSVNEPRRNKKKTVVLE